MGNINRVTLSGNLTRDIEAKQSHSGTSIITFGVAVNERVKDSSTGQWEERPVYVDCVVFGKRAESLANILRKGMKVCIEGHLSYSTWDDKTTGKKRSKLEVIVDDIDIMQRRDSQGQQQTPQGQYVQQTSNYPQQQQYSPQGGYQQPQQPYQPQYQQQGFYPHDQNFGR